MEKPEGNIDAISTGSLGLDIALGVGGFAKGRVIEIYGPESSGKTTLTLHVLAEAQKKDIICAFIDVEHAFDPVYAKNIGVGMIIASPDMSLLNYLEQKVVESNIKIAIHNGGPEDKWYPTAGAVYDHIKSYDKRIGICLDIGHSQRAGVNPIEAYNQHAERVIDMHIKDVEAAAEDAHEVELGRGMIDIPALVSSLFKRGYTGRCSIEYQKNLDEPLEGIAESVGYFKGVCKALNFFEKRIGCGFIA